MPKHKETPIPVQALLLTIIFTVLSCLIWGELTFLLLKTPAGQWMRQGIDNVTSKWHSLLDTSEGNLDVDLENAIVGTPLMVTMAAGAKNDLPAVVGVTQEKYPYALFLYPVSQKIRLPEDFPTTSAQLPLIHMGDVMVAEIIQEPLEELIKSAKLAGYSPYLRSGFRSIVDQHTAFSRYVTEGTASGRSLNEAREYAMQFSAEPGYSEHHLGLAVDLLDYYYPDWSVARKNYDKGLYLWLRQHAHEYGFVISYPAGADGIHSKPGSGYSLSEPWHLRFLGIDLANWFFKNGYLDVHSDITINGVLIEIQEGSIVGQ